MGVRTNGYFPSILKSQNFLISIILLIIVLHNELIKHDIPGNKVMLVSSNMNGKKQYKTFYGMSSDTAMKKYSGGVANYRSSEGKTVKIPYKGPVKNTILDLLGGIRSTCTYVGASDLKYLSKCTTFIRVTQQLNEVYGKS